ncbi:uncharacterized protein JCM15063_002453 [Sporobolomyces koalae]|uniref:uncharacterized protein n=1 Tax=Sporobolomyces koalae TaxID=500713 RepID=UPI00317E5CED
MSYRPISAFQPRPPSPPDAPDSRTRAARRPTLASAPPLPHTRTSSTSSTAAAPRDGASAYRPLNAFLPSVPARDDAHRRTEPRKRRGDETSLARSPRTRPIDPIEDRERPTRRAPHLVSVADPPGSAVDLKPLTTLHRAAPRPRTPVPRERPANDSASLSSISSKLLRSLNSEPASSSSPSDQSVRDAKALASILARAPRPRDSDHDERREDSLTLHDEEFSFSSPEKSRTTKSRSYLPSGIAARAHSILTANKTDHALWHHDLSRRLESYRRTDDPARSHSNRIELEELECWLEPELKLRVLQTFRETEDDTTELGPQAAVIEPNLITSRRRRQSRKTLLTQCQLVLPNSDQNDSNSSNRQDLIDPSLIGLVLFSLHDATNPTTTNPIYPVPVSSDQSLSANRNPTLVFPRTSRDLDTIQTGTQVWVFSSSSSSTISTRSKTTTKATERGGGGDTGEYGRGIYQVELNELGSTWKIQDQRDLQATRTRGLERTDREGFVQGHEQRKEMIKKGLVVTKFVLVI